MNTSVRDCVRCSAITAKGTRCSRTTCIYPGMCCQHFKARNGLKLAPSNIPNAGLGEQYNLIGKYQIIRET